MVERMKRETERRKNTQHTKQKNTDKMLN